MALIIKESMMEIREEIGVQHYMHFDSRQEGKISL